MKYKIGDKVNVRDDLEHGKWYGVVEMFVNEMAPWRGKEVTIADMFEAGDRSYRYLIEEDGEEWCWTSEMFEPEGVNKNG